MTDDSSDLPGRAQRQLTHVIRHWIDAVEMTLPGVRINAHPSHIDTAASSIVAALTSDDLSMRHEGLISLIPWLGPDTMPVTDGWWTTPLGLLATAAQHDDDEDGWITQQQAAAALGVSRATVTRLLDAGTIRRRDGRGPDARTVNRRDVAEIIREQAVHDQQT